MLVSVGEHYQFYHPRMWCGEGPVPVVPRLALLSAPSGRSENMVLCMYSICARPY